MNDCAAVLAAPDLLRSSQAVASANGGQLSPTAGDGAGGAGDQPASSSAASDLTGDAEGVWSADIDQAFQEALAIYPPCGRRKIIISDEGKMYGRNELIARYIKIRCGKTRTRKQVSSHIQVLARKKARDDAAKKKGDQVTITPTPAPAQLPVVPAPVAASAASQPPRVPPATAVPNFAPLQSLPLADPKEQLKILQNVQSLTQGMYNPISFNPFFMGQPFHPAAAADMKPLYGLPNFALQPDTTIKEPESPSERLSIESSTLRLNGFTAYVEDTGGSRVDIVNIPKFVPEVESISMADIADKYPPLLRELYNQGPSDAFYLAKCWANVHFTANDSSSLFAVDSYYTSRSKFDISVSTKVCSFGAEQVEKVEVYSPNEEHGQYSFRLEKSPMCDYMVRFIYKLKELESEDWMNNVLENFTVLQVITNKTTGENLMVLCFLFEVNKEPDTTCSLFQLTP